MMRFVVHLLLAAVAAAAAATLLAAASWLTGLAFHRTSYSVAAAVGALWVVRYHR